MQQQIAKYVTDHLQNTNSFDTWHGKHLCIREIGSGMQKLHMHHHFSLLTEGYGLTAYFNVHVSLCMISWYFIWNSLFC